MLLFIVAWLFIGWLSLVLGVSALKALGPILTSEKEKVKAIQLDYLILFGFTITIFLCSLISLLSPINGWINLIFIGVGLGLHYQNRTDIGLILKKNRKAFSAYPSMLKIVMGIVCIVALFAAFIEIGETDTWFYHSESVRWIKEFPAVPGLGNIHGRFAFNSNYFVATAFYALLFTEEYVIFPIFSFFFIVLNIRLLDNIYQSIQTNKGVAFVLSTLLIIFFDFHAIDLISSTSTDIITCVVLFYVFFLFYEAAFKDDRPFEQVILWGLVALAVTFKLSSLLIVFLLLFTIPAAIKSRRFGVFLGVAILVGAPFIARNIIISGYLLYPFPSLDVISVDWKIPIEEVQLEKDLVEGWAKQPYGSDGIDKFEDIPKILELPFGEWMKVWLPAQSKKWLVFMVINLIGLPLLGLWTILRKEYKNVILLATIFINLLFWFDQAPQPRFAYGFLFFGVALVLAYASSFVLKYFHPKQLIFPILGLFIAGLVLIRPETKFTEIKGLSLLVYPSYITKIETETFEAQNFTMLVPSAAPPASTYWCFNAPVPCTPLPKETVQMRGKTFRQGFRVVARNE
ncbi:MAG: hypothetical protein R2828_32130 [Saprospiraceae bacterium]